MAIVNRKYSANGPASTAKLVEFVDASTAIASQYPSSPIVDIQIDDAIGGAIDTLDAYMAQLGYVYVATPPALQAWSLAAGPGGQADRIPIYAKDASGTMQLFAQIADGTEYQLTPTLETTGSIAIAQSVPGDFNFSTLGTFDWMFPELWAATAGKQNWHGKKAGGWLLDSFSWVSSVSTGTDARGWINTAAVTDDVIVAGLAGTKTLNGFNGPVINTGYRFRIPCSSIPRVVRFQGTMFNVQTVTTARFSEPGIGTTQTLNRNTGAASGLDYRHEVTFSGPSWASIIIDHVITAYASGGTGNLYVGAIGVADA